jgi:23S rRNA (guanosine2251-2'-O)-methyltransferase
MTTKAKYYFIYGKHAALSALKNPNRVISKILCTKDFIENKDFKKYILSKNFREVSRAELDKLLGTNSIHQGIAVETMPITSDDLATIDLEQNQSLIILDQITDQQNFGSILRSAVTFGIKNIIVSSKNCAKENSSLAKAASGALEFVNIVEVVNINQTIEILKKKGFWTIGLDHNSSTYLHEYQIPDKLAIILGSEDQGIRKLTREKCDTLVKIPIIQNDSIDSLNVSVACAISLYEIFKKRNFKL